ncbi:MAG: bifunctional adenosylcobinamide kinase/adenosylcobinamide-phosphate guanylyltransferase [Opitutales bacterium]
MNSQIHFLLGGSRSGKSRRAEELAIQSRLPVSYVATWLIQFDDAEMEARVQTHRNRRPPEWQTVENRTDLANILRENAGRCVLLDCLTLWLGARMSATQTEANILNEWTSILQVARESLPLFLIVSNEVGCGVVPESSAGRAFRDLAGRANQATAAEAERVELLVAGIPLPVKGKTAS